MLRWVNHVVVLQGRSCSFGRPLSIDDDEFWFLANFNVQQRRMKLKVKFLLHAALNESRGCFARKIMQLWSPFVPR